MLASLESYQSCGASHCDIKEVVNLCELDPPLPLIWDRCMLEATEPARNFLLVPAHVSDAGTAKPVSTSFVQYPAAVRLAQLRVVLPRVTAAQHTAGRSATAPVVSWI